ncbi:hypothetical protein SDC9_203033 [bioreactor metagenome]|uniref:Uncharacterized protein n=1 Tax=bioreactor metagenome TaxID=1076179 RepID=A0A645IVI9_9ZZZZ
MGIVIEGQQVVAFGEVARYQLEGLGVDGSMAQIDALFAQAFRERMAQRGFGHKPERYQQLADRLVLLHLLQQGDAQLVFRQDAFGDQDLSERATLEDGSAHRGPNAALQASVRPGVSRPWRGRRRLAGALLLPGPCGNAGRPGGIGADGQG